MRLRHEAAWQDEAVAAQQLFGLAASMLKSASVVCSNAFSGKVCGSGGSCPDKSVLSAVMYGIDLAVRATFTSEGFPANLQLLLRGRLLLVLGVVCSISSSDAWADLVRLGATGYNVLRNALQDVEACEQLLGKVQLPGEAAAAAEAAQQLQQQAAVLKPMLQQQLQVLEQAGDAAIEHLQQEADTADTAELATGPAPIATAAQTEEVQAAEADHDSSHATEVSLQQQLQRAFPGDLLQQLQQFGEAVCHQLPVSLWCCNPRCSKLQKQSEQELVGGKACVCSACRTARFCSKECLQACWKKQLHRGVCKRIAAARQQQQQ
jgi:hypothetical protein